MYLYLIEVYTDVESWEMDAYTNNKFLIVAKDDTEAENKSKEEIKKGYYDCYEIERIEEIEGHQISVK